MESINEPACPQCGAPLTRRLAEYECPQCGYFISEKALRRGGAGPAPEGRGVASLPARPGRRGLAQLDDPARGERRWLTLKRGYLLVLFIGLVGGTLIKAWLVPTFTVTAHFVWLVALASLIPTGLAALVLFIDWRAFRLAGQVAALLLLIACGYELYLWDGKDQLRLALIVFNVMLVLALAAINQFDIMRMR
jgi:hypothetical protein